MSTPEEKKFWQLFAEIQNTGKQAKDEAKHQRNRREDFFDKLVIGILLAIVALLLKLLFK